MKKHRTAELFISTTIALLALSAPRGSWLFICAFFLLWIGIGYELRSIKFKKLLPGAIVLCGIPLSLAGYLNIGLAICSIVCLLSLRRPYVFPIAIVACSLELSGTISLISYFRETSLGTTWIGLAFPGALIAIGLAFFFPLSRLFEIIFAVTITLFFLKFSVENEMNIGLSSQLGSLILCLTLAAIFSRSDFHFSQLRALVFSFGAVAWTLLTWAIVPPSSIETLSYFLPDAPDRYESRYFTNYKDSLLFAEILADSYQDNRDQVSKGLVVIPWITNSKKFLDDLDQLVSDNTSSNLTLLIGGEHSNMGGVSDFLHGKLKSISLGNDLSIPPSNSDFLGMTRSTILAEFGRNGAINRGARVISSSPFTKPLLIGDHWFTEPDIGEPSYVGDYRFSKHDIAGWITLAAIAEHGGIRWLIVGDNSFLLNHQVVADPNLLKQLLRAATLWPTAIRDVLLLFLLLIVIYQGLSQQACPLSFWVIAIVPIFAFGLSFYDENLNSETWKRSYAHQSGFDSRNFNTAISKITPELQASDTLLVREPNNIPSDNENFSSIIYFGHVQENQRIGGATFSNCERVGKIPYAKADIQDGQVCAVTGSLNVLLGKKDSALAVSTKINEKVIYVILDRQFLANRNTSEKNTNWVKSLLTDID